MKKKDILFILIGVVLVFSLGFLLRGVFIEEPPIVIEKPEVKPEVDEEKLRAEIRSEIKAEIDALVTERMRIIALDQMIEGFGFRDLHGEVVFVDYQAQTIEIQLRNELRLFTGGSLVEFLKQPHYFMKTVLVTNETDIKTLIEEGSIDSVFQEIRQGDWAIIVTDQPFKVGTEETLIAERIILVPGL